MSRLKRSPVASLDLTLRRTANHCLLLCEDTLDLPSTVRELVHQVRCGLAVMQEGSSKPIDTTPIAPPDEADYVASPIESDFPLHVAVPEEITRPTRFLGQPPFGALPPVVTSLGPGT